MLWMRLKPKVIYVYGLIGNFITLTGAIGKYFQRRIFDTEMYRN